MSDHAVLSPSKAHRWVHCPGSIVACNGVPDTGSIYADEGTAAHAVAAHRLLDKPGPAAADVETSDYINVYTSAVRNAAEGKILLVEQRLDIARWTGEKGGKGTSDAIIIDLKNAEIEVWDLKFGAGHVVHAQDNEQLMLYALGALDMVEMLYHEIKTIKMVICQPRRDHISEHTITRDELIAFGKIALEKGTLALALLAHGHIGDELHPGAETCLWCPIKATCPALEEMNRNAVFEEFEIVGDDPKPPKLRPVEGDVLTEDMLDLIAQWVSAKRAWISDQLKAGKKVPGWKLVLGKKGNRKWRNETEVAAVLSADLKIDEKTLYERSLIPLTKIEKLVSTAVWKKYLEPLVTQADGQPIAVDVSNEKPEYTKSSKVEDFQSTEGDYNAFV